MSSPLSTPGKLGRAIGGMGFFALGFGSIVGSGWVVVLGEWLSSAGPLGAVIGFIGGGLLMAMVAATYAELVARLPRAGGEFLFVLNGLGRRAGFLTGWFLTLYIISFTAFEAFALAWFLELLFPALSRATVLYSLLGHNITIHNLGLGIAGAILLTASNALGANLAIKLQRTVTFAFIILSAVLILVGFGAGNADNLQPLFKPDGGESAIRGVFWIFATSLLFLSGFQSAANAVEDRAHHTSLRTIAEAMISAVLAAAVFYCLIILSVSSMVPWQTLITQPLPAVTAFENALPGGLAAKGILIAAIISLAKTWNALHLSASRLVLAQAREGFLPSWLAHVDEKRGVPIRATVFVGLGTMAWLFAGRGAILPIINMSTICVALIMVLTLAGLWRLRTTQTAAPEFVAPGKTAGLVAAMAATVLAAGIALVSPFQAAPGIPLEFTLIAAWGGIGVILQFWTTRRHG